MVTYYFRDPEEALKRAKAAGKQPGCWWGGITLRSGKKGWAIYKDRAITLKNGGAMVVHIEK